MTEVTANLILISICLSVFEQIWTKRQKFSGICTLCLCRSLCHQHLCDIVFSSVFSFPLCALYKIRPLVYHSIFRKNKKLTSSGYNIVIFLITICAYPNNRSQNIRYTRPYVLSTNTMCAKPPHIVCGAIKRLQKR